MREMKDSGIEWIGEIPKEWDTVKIKHLANRESGSFTDGDWIDSPYIVDEGIRYLTSGNIGDGEYKEQGNGHITEETFRFLNCTYAYPGDLVFSRLNTPYGRSCILPNICPEYVLAVDNVILRTDEDKRFISYLTQCAGYHHEVEGKANGTAMKRISRTDLGNIPLPVAPKSEQSRIADYLDKKCAEIDALIAAKEKTNALLKERRQSIIYEAVTKGLDPTAPMKDSGIEWIGMIPEGWDCVKISRVIQNNKDGIRVGPFGSALTNAVVSSQYGTVKIYGQANLIRKDFTFGDNYVSQETYERLSEYEVLPNDIAVSMMGTIGKCCVVPSDIVKGIMDSHLIKIRLKDSYYPRFFEYIYESDAVYEQLVAAAKGSIMSGLNSSIVKNVYVTLPGIEEQSAIVNYLDSECSRIDSTIIATESTIEKLKEFRQSVIYEAVTGKVEV